ncbi:SusC/RagA family TonB-linked outer membrane protein [Flavobacterium antarcticum]|uniref:SusC/RagA family TonB-linked outer membrane protein n=1 Tax=Flavobacterium antarcticum TaxID=271155 RepID=UPI0003B65386|nr:SusC/RagA family TonB-linked outer membrane protein [Flavobacterium antarcticum]
MKSKLTNYLALLLVLIGQFAFAQERSVKGTVTDNDGLPLPGVSILVKGTSTGTQTDMDGKFSILASPTQVLVVTYIGMKSQEVKATSQNLTVKLQDDATELEGVVVTALGIKRDKKALGYAATTISKEDITNVVTNNPLESLSGKVAGVDISAPTQPGASTKVIVRGIGSISGTNQPLYVIDGTPINNSASGSTSTTRSFDGGTGLNDLDPNSIEKITFLKGSAATALYGSRAGRGAVIITTKKGKNSSKINVDFVTSLDVNEVARVPHLQNQFGQGWNGQGFSQLSTGAGPSNENGSWGPAFNGEIRPWGTVYDNSQQIKPYVALKDNVRDFYEKGLTTTNSINISGGGEFSDFSLGFTNMDSDGVIPTNSDAFVKRSFTFNGGIKNERTSIRTNINFTNRDQNAVNTGQGDDAGEGSTLMQDLLQIPRDVSVVDFADYQNNPFNTPSYYFTPYSANPYFSLNENSTKILGNNLFGNININHKITDNLSASWQVGGNYRVENVKSYGAIVNYLPGSAQDLGAANPVVGGVTEGRVERSEFDTYFNLNYDRMLSEDFKLNLLAGISYNQREGNTLYASVTGLDVPNFYELSNSANRPEISQNNSLRRTFGYYGQAELSFKERLFLTLSGRQDKTSTLPTNNNSYFYPAASLSGIVIDNGANFLKLRGAVSQVANDTDPYQTESSLVTGNAAANFGLISSPFGGINFYELSGVLGNINLKPERTTEYEVGFEASLFRRKVTFDVSYYNRKTEDLIVAVPLDPSTGYSSQASNIGDVVNKGIEVAVGLTPFKTDNFSWNLNYTFAKNDNEVTRVNGGSRIEITKAYGITFAAEEGRPIGSFYAQVPVVNADGQYVVNPDTGYYKVTDELEYVADGQRDFIMGLQNTLKYKNVSVSFGFDWKQGGKMYSYTKRLSHFVGNGIETAYNDRNTFIIPNSVNEVVDGTGNVTGYTENTTPITFENITNFWGNTSNNPGVEKDHLIDKTFIRLRDISLYYDFSSKIAEQIGLTKLSVGVYGRNLFMWTPAENPYIDPEVTSYGNDLLSEFGEFGANPSQRVFGGSIKLSF